MIKTLPIKKLIALVAYLTAPAFLASACNQASFHVVPPAQTGIEPQNLENNASEPLVPTARVGATFNNGSATTATVGAATTIQLSNDKISLNFIATSRRSTPDIVRADYTIKTQAGDVPVSAVCSPSACDSLSAPDTLKTASDNPITMIVTDENNLTANANDSASLVVDDSDNIVSQLDAYLSTKPVFTELTIEEHTDSTGSDSYNTALSKRRVETIRKLLIDKYHLQADKILAIVRGDSMPIADNGNHQDRQLNRRVAVTIYRDMAK
ncbi:MAG: OmpA family protein [Proteobacteria bacterium]|nr:OmpA family protein [Pseudomonadota bacterium]